MSLRDGILGLLFPRNCFGCGVTDPEPLSHLCRECLWQVQPLADPMCIRCGRPAWGQISSQYVCSFCEDTQPHYDRARSVLLYDGIAADMIRALKYRGALWLAGDLGAFLRHGLERFYGRERFDLITFVPLHPLRHRLRGYNQAALLAGAVARASGDVLVRPTLRRIRMSASQTRLTARQRLHNVRDAFAVRRRGRRWLQGKRILLVDDVMTTGATVSECARALKAAGAEKVCVLTAARTLY